MSSGDDGWPMRRETPGGRAQATGARWSSSGQQERIMTPRQHDMLIARRAGMDIVS
ncbi:hypothetical protein [Demequina litorisediminis]|uniref:hypothetical protein n=1 Tax=Demequina litorisediminis TaxID=1849022 RepID=UPI0024E091C7|nr:hypothetical protein [Demequina litorisediminis]